MKRYILLLVLVSMQANVTLPNGIWERVKFNLKSSFQSKMSAIFGCFKFRTAHAQDEKELEERRNRYSKFRKKVELAADKRNLIEDGLGKKGTIVEEFENKFDYLVDKDLNSDQLNEDFCIVKYICSNYVRLLREALPACNGEIIMDQGGQCIADFAGFKEEPDNQQAITWSSEFKKAREVAYDNYKSGVPGSLRYVFLSSPARENDIAKTKKMSEERLKSWTNTDSHIRVQPDKSNLGIPSSEVGL